MRMNVCECGCGDRTKGGKFLPGHDQKLRAEIERAAGGILKLRSLVEADKGVRIICRADNEN